MPKPKRMSIGKKAVIVGAIGLGISAAAGVGLAYHNANKHKVELPYPENFRKDSNHGRFVNTPDNGPKVTEKNSGVKKDEQRKSGINRIESLKVFEPKNKSEYYKLGERVNESNFMKFYSSATSMEQKLDFVTGFCYRFYFADEYGGHFDLKVMSNSISGLQLREILAKFMINRQIKSLRNDPNGKARLEIFKQTIPREYQKYFEQGLK